MTTKEAGSVSDGAEHNAPSTPVGGAPPSLLCGSNGRGSDIGSNDGVTTACGGLSETDSALRRYSWQQMAPGWAVPSIQMKSTCITESRARKAAGNA